MNVEINLEEIIEKVILYIIFFIIEHLLLKIKNLSLEFYVYI
jgi:hypothetical protein